MFVDIRRVEMQISQKALDEMRFYAEFDDYSDPDRYETFAKECGMDKKAFEIGGVIVELANLMPNNRPLTILETASATGLTAVGVTAELKKAGIAYIYTSLDIEPKLLEFASIRGRGDRFVRGSFNCLQFGADMFDIYIMMGAEGYREMEKFYSEVYRVLRPGGYYVMPQIGREPVKVRPEEKAAAERAGLTVIRADNYLVAQKT